MAARNADSMGNQQGEFHPTKPRDEPLTDQGHQPGKLVGNDAAPEFHAQTLPPGSAPAANTFKPNPINETPGQANNPDTLRAHGKESTYTGPLDGMSGATSGDVHTGLGHPGQGQTANEVRKDGKHTSKKERSGLEGLAQGGSGLRDDGSAESERLTKDHKGGPTTGHNVSLAGAEEKQTTTSEELAAEQPKVQQHDQSGTGVLGSGNVSKS